MDEYESLSHTKWECKYHVVFIPKCRRKTLYVELRKHLGEVFRHLAQQKESRIEEGHLLKRPRAHADRDTAEICGVAGGRVLQRQERDHLARGYGERKRSFVGQHFWARGYRLGCSDDVRNGGAYHDPPGIRSTRGGLQGGNQGAGSWSGCLKVALRAPLC